MGTISNNEKEYLLETLKMLEEKLLQTPEDKSVTVHITSKLFKIHQDFLPLDIEINLDEELISIDTCSDYGDSSWVFTMEEVRMALVDYENNIIEFLYEIMDETEKYVIDKLNVAFHF